MLLTLQNSKPPKDNLFNYERKTLKELQSDTSIITLSAEKYRPTVFFNCEDYLEKTYGSYKQCSISNT